MERMPEDRWIWYTGAALIGAGAVLLFLAWFALGFGSSIRNESGIEESWLLATWGMLLVVVGLGLFVLEARLMAKRDSDSVPLYLFLTANLVAAIVVLLTVFNPLVSS